MEDEEEGKSVMPGLIEGTDLTPPAPPVDTINPLGQEPVDYFVLGVLSTAGISVELVKAYGDSPLYLAAQILDNEDIRDAMTTTSYDNVRWQDQDDFLGLQVKLGGAHKWKITIAQQMKGQHVAESGRPGRRGADRTPPAEKHTIVNHNNWEVVVPVQIGEKMLMKSTATTAFGITINIAFQTKEETHDVKVGCWNATNGMPLIEQRRIDVMFANKYACDVQVRRSGTLELWNSRALERNGILTAAARTCAHRPCGTTPATCFPTCAAACATTRSGRPPSTASTKTCALRLPTGWRCGRRLRRWSTSRR